MDKQPQLPKGHTSILSPAFRYVPAVSTDLGKTFARIRTQRLAQRGKDASIGLTTERLREDRASRKDEPSQAAPGAIASGNRRARGSLAPA